MTLQLLQLLGIYKVIIDHADHHSKRIFQFGAIQTRRIFVVSNTLFSVIKPNTLLCCWFCARVYKCLSSDIVVFTDVLGIRKYLLIGKRKKLSTKTGQIPLLHPERRLYKLTNCLFISQSLATRPPTPSRSMLQNRDNKTIITGCQLRQV